MMRTGLSIRITNIASCRLYLLIILAFSAWAQDPFELHVYESEALPPGVWTIETHLNYVPSGTTTAAGSLLPTDNQAHVTLELTRGLAPNIAIGAMFLTATGPRVAPGIRYAGWRILPHVAAPKSWKLPVDLGLVVEISFQDQRYEENTRQIEVRPVIEKNVGRYQFDFNPVFERGLKGQGSSEGWVFEPNLRLGYEVSKKLDASLEYYGTLGPVRGIDPLRQQVHQIYPGVDWKITEHLLCNLGVGFGLTPTGNQLVVKSRLEYEWGRK
jgi:hypothetical protein